MKFLETAKLLKNKEIEELRSGCNRWLMITRGLFFMIVRGLLLVTKGISVNLVLFF